MINIAQFFPVAPEKLFSYFVDPQKFARWFFPDDCVVDEAMLEGERGGRFLVRMRDANGATLLAKGVVLDIVPPVSLSFTWQWQSEGFVQNETRVDIAISAERGGARLTIVHSGVVADEKVIHVDGWQSALRKLAHLNAEPP